MFEAELQIMIKEILKNDEKFQKDKIGSYCSECHKNTFVGYKPFESIYRRTICEYCGNEYEKFLKLNGMSH